MPFEAYIQRQRRKFEYLAPQDRPFAKLQAHAAPGVLLLHGSAATPCNHRILAQALFAQGYSVYAPLLAGHGNLGDLHQGKTPWTACLNQALRDAEAFQDKCTETHVLGASFGGTLAYLMGIERPDLFRTVMALSAPVMANDGWNPRDPWGIEVKGAIVALDRHLPDFHLPLLVGHAFDDDLVLVKNAYTAFSRVRTARKKMVIYQGVGHGLGFAQNTLELTADLGQFMAFTQSPLPFSLHVMDRGYTQLSLAGSFNAWNAQSLPFYRTSQGWQCEIMLPPGDYTYKLVVDGQHWILDREAEIVHSPHGEKNSLLRIKT